LFHPEQVTLLSYHVTTRHHNSE